MALHQTNTSDTFETWRVNTNALDNAVGNLVNLTTTDKTSIIAAINEIKALVIGVSATETRAILTATGGETSITVAYTVGLIDVFLNGLKLQEGVDITVTSGTSIGFTVALVAGDVVQYTYK